MKIFKSNLSRLIVFSTLIVLGLLITSFAKAASTHYFDTDSNYNFLLDSNVFQDYLASFHGKQLRLVDIDGDGKKDIVVGGINDTAPPLTLNGSVWIIYATRLEELEALGVKSLDLTNPDHFNVRIDGVSVDEITDSGLYSGDLNNDGAQDLVICTDQSQNHVANSGSAWIIDNSLIPKTGTGNTMPLSNSANFTLRYDGAAIADKITAEGGAYISDINGDSKDDLAIVSVNSDNNGRNQSGSIYLFYSDLITSQEVNPTGNIVELDTAGSFSLRIDGASASDKLGSVNDTSISRSVVAGDINNNGTPDLVVGGDYGDYGPSYSNNGASWVIYDDIIAEHPVAGSTLDLSNPNNYTVQIIGSNDYTALTFSRTPLVDVDGDNKLDLIFHQWIDSDRYTYILKNDLIGNYVDRGNLLDLSQSSDYSISINFNGAYLPLSVYKRSNEGVDMVVPDMYGGTNSQGTLSILNNTNYFAAAGTGNDYSIDLGTEANVIYYGKQVIQYGLTSNNYDFADIDGDGSLDTVISAEDRLIPNGGGGWTWVSHGNLYIIYNFPHAVTTGAVTESGGSYSLAGNITVAARSTTSLVGVQYRLGGGSWAACSASDGAFDETNEDYTCGFGPLADGNYTADVRAYDSDGSFTPLANYGIKSFVVGGGPVLDHIIVSPPNATVSIGGNQTFTAVAYTAGDVVIPGTIFTWSAVAGGGSVDGSGVFTAGATPGTYTNTVKATSGAVSGYATVVVSAVSPPVPPPTPPPTPFVTDDGRGGGTDDSVLPTVDQLINTVPATSILNFITDDANDYKYSLSGDSTPEITGHYPIFSGNSDANTELIIKIMKDGTEVLSDTFYTLPDGSWSYQTKSELEPGEYQVSVSEVGTGGAGDGGSPWYNFTVKESVGEQIGQIGEDVGIKFKDIFEVLRESNTNLINIILLIAASILMVNGLLNAFSGFFSAEVSLKQYFLAFFNSLFVVGGKRKKIGFVYDSASGKKVHGALVSMFEGASVRLKGTALTDKAGHYVFSADKGTYLLSVKKSGYLFPSRYRIEVSENYYGQPLSFNNDSNVIKEIIPIDPIENAARRESIYFKMYVNVFISAAIRWVVLLAGTLIAVFALIINPVGVNFVILGCYIFLYVLEFILQHKEASYCRVINAKTHQPVDLALVRIFNSEGKLSQTYVTDRQGRVAPYTEERNCTLAVERAGFKKAEQYHLNPGAIVSKKIYLQPENLSN